MKIFYHNDIPWTCVEKYDYIHHFAINVKLNLMYSRKNTPFAFLPPDFLRIKLNYIKVDGRYHY
jgi:hypothetical protein